jgi:hypothetical protein
MSKILNKDVLKDTSDVVYCHIREKGRTLTVALPVKMDDTLATIKRRATYWCSMEHFGFDEELIFPQLDQISEKNMMSMKFSDMRGTFGYKKRCGGKGFKWNINVNKKN